MAYTDSVERRTTGVWIETIRVEGGALDGFQQQLHPGLNVLIGGRGTGKSSVIELIRFCLGAPASSDAAAKDALEHALGVLGDGKVTVTLSDGAERVEVSRIAGEDVSDDLWFLPLPLVFSQKEIEQVGAQSQSRMRLVDGFLPNRRSSRRARAPREARIKSISTEIRSLLAEIDDVSERLLALPKLQARLAELQLLATEQRSRSSELDTLRGQLDFITPRASAASVVAASIERSSTRLSGWTDELETTASRHPHIEAWPADAGTPDQVNTHRSKLERANQILVTLITEYRGLAAELEALLQAAQRDKAVIEATGREVRQRIEEQQKGASVLDRQIAEISQEVAALNALSTLKEERSGRIRHLNQERQAALDELHERALELTESRRIVAASLTEALLPAIRVKVRPLADYRSYLNSLFSCLRGSGLRYRELAERIVQTFSPQEIAVLAENGETRKIAEALEITEDRAHRVADAVRSDAGTELLTTEVGDEVVIELLDGSSFKPTDFLSMGQRCTAILPIILQHKESIVVLDQPEDHLDNAFIVETLVQSIRVRSGLAQTIVATHNPNIPVLGDADWVAHLESDGERCFVSVVGGLGDLDIVNSITSVMEGGKEAFQKRADFYAQRRIHDE